MNKHVSLGLSAFVFGVGAASAATPQTVTSEVAGKTVFREQSQVSEPENQTKSSDSATTLALACGPGGVKVIPSCN